MYAFDYHRPDSLRKAASLAATVEDAKFLAGGHTLLPTMKQRLASPSALIDLNRVKELVGIELRGRTIVIGAMTRHASVEHAPEVQQALPALAELAHLIGDPQVRHRGTIGGSVANNDPAADYPAACIALGATIVTNKRKLAADEFFTGLFDTALEDGEIITKVVFPLASRAAYAKFRNPASRYALAGVFVAKRGSDIRVAVIGAGESGVFRLPEFEEALKKRFSPKSIEGLKVSPDGLIGDIHADPAYRAQLVAVMARRAVAKAAARAS